LIWDKIIYTKEIFHKDIFKNTSLEYINDVGVKSIFYGKICREGEDDDSNIPFLKSNFKVKKENVFYDLDQNLDFFINFFKYFVNVSDITSIVYYTKNSNVSSISSYGEKTNSSIDKQYEKYANIRTYL
jgi:hypothetical protein